MRSRGFTLIELLIAVSIFVFLIMLAGPQYAQFLASSQVRNAAEAILNGVQQAQAAALKVNGTACLKLDKTTRTGGWQILETNTDTGTLTDCGGWTSLELAQAYKLKDGAPDAALTVTPGDATYITFDGFGRLIQTNPDDSVPTQLRCIDVTNSRLSAARPMRVVISNDPSKTGTKLCDPAVPQTEPQACPLACS